MTSRRLTRPAAALVVALFVVQVTVALGVYIDLQSRDMPAALRVLGDASPYPGDSAALRIGVYDRHSSRLLGMSWVSAEIASEGVSVRADVEPPIDEQSMAIASYTAPDIATAELRVNVEAPVVGVRELSATVTPVGGVRWLDDADVMGGEGTARSTNRSQGGEVPGVRPRPSDDTCPWRLDVVADGGVVPRELSGRLYVRLVDADGGGRAHAEIGVRSEEDTEARAIRTDATGGAEVDVVVAWPETWTFSFDCDGAAVSREVRIVPSWDGLRVVPSPMIVAEGEPLRLNLDHQRQHGVWHADITCDGRRVWTGTMPIRNGDSRIEIPVPARAPSPGGVRLCAVTGYLYPMAPDPPRSVHPFLLRGHDIDDAGALSALLESLSARGTAAARASATPALIGAVDGLDGARRTRLLGWALASVSAPYVPMPVLADDLDDTLAAFRVEQSSRRRGLLALLGVDALLVVLVLAGIVIPAMFQQRRALLNTMNEAGELPDDEDPGEATRVAAPAVAVAAVGLSVVIVSLVGLALLLYYLQ